MRRPQLTILMLFASACASFGPGVETGITTQTLARRTFDALDEELEALSQAPAAEGATKTIALARGWVDKGRAAVEDGRPKHAAMYIERIRSQLDLVRLELRRAGLERALDCELQRQAALAQEIARLEALLNRGERGSPEGEGR